MPEQSYIERVAERYARERGPIDELNSYALQECRDDVALLYRLARPHVRAKGPEDHAYIERGLARWASLSDHERLAIRLTVH